MVSQQFPVYQLGAGNEMFAEDGKTLIYPERGTMAGKAVTVKNKKSTTKQLMTSILGVSKFKTRWYILDSQTFVLSWASLDRTAEEHEETNTLHMSRVSGRGQGF